ncbi:MAG: RIP metalloprotease RseP [Gammaproteobacteria bacterium]
MDILFSLLIQTWDWLLNLAFYLAVFAVMIGVLVAVHEYGHFLAARFFKVRVLSFSVGFGPDLLRWFDRQGTKFSIAAVPLGGYVLMQNGDEEDAARYPGESYKDASLPARLIICFAGPLANILLAVVIQAGILAYGLPDTAAIIGKVEPASVAEQAGLRPQDRVVEIDGDPISGLGDMQLALLQHAGSESVPIGVERADLYQSQLDLYLNLTSLQGADPNQNLLMLLGVTPLAWMELWVGTVVSDGPAEKAGVQVGDRIHAINEQPIQGWQNFVQLVQENPGQEIRLDIERSESRVALTVVPEAYKLGDVELGRVGIGRGRNPDLISYRQVPIWWAPFEGVERVYDLTLLTVKSLWRLLIGELGLENLSGPVGIAQISGNAAQAGVLAFLMVMSLLSISLGVINLAPIPVLDGGRALIHMIEGVMRRPLPVRVEGMLNMVGFALVGSLMLWTIAQDISRL